MYIMRLDQAILRHAAFLVIRPDRSELFLAVPAHCQSYAEHGGLFEFCLDILCRICLDIKEIVPALPEALLFAAAALAA